MAHQIIRNVEVVGIATCVPSTIEENISQPFFKEGEAEKVIASTGIERRRIAPSEVTASDLCYTAAAKLLAEYLTEEESAVYRRGRNAGGTPSKNADPAEYRQATGLEAVFGYLQLMGQTERIEALFRIIWENRESLLHNA